jgi:hypothetical protein
LVGQCDGLDDRVVRRFRQVQGLESYLPLVLLAGKLLWMWLALLGSQLTWLLKLTWLRLLTWLRCIDHCSLGLVLSMLLSPEVARRWLAFAYPPTVPCPACRTGFLGVTNVVAVGAPQIGVAWPLLRALELLSRLGLGSSLRLRSLAQTSVVIAWPLMRALLTIIRWTY